MGIESASSKQKLLKEKPRRSLQMLCNFKQEPATEALLTFFVSLNFQGIDAQPGPQLLLGQAAKGASHRNAFTNLNRQIAVKGWR